MTLPPLQKDIKILLVWSGYATPFNVTFVVCKITKCQTARSFLNTGNMYKLNCILRSSVSNVCRQLVASVNATGSSL